MCTKGDKVMLYQDDKKLNPHAEEITLKKNDEVSITMQAEGGFFTCEIIPFRELYFIPHVAGQSFTRLSGYMTLYKKSLLLSLSHHLQKTQTISGINTFFSIIHSSTL